VADSILQPPEKADRSNGLPVVRTPFSRPSANFRLRPPIGRCWEDVVGAREATMLGDDWGLAWGAETRSGLVQSTATFGVVSARPSRTNLLATQVEK